MHKLAEAQHDAKLLGVDAHGEAEKADRRNEHDGQERREWASHAPAGHGLANAVLSSA